MEQEPIKLEDALKQVIRIAKLEVKQAKESCEGQTMGANAPLYIKDLIKKKNK